MNTGASEASLDAVKSSLTDAMNGTVGIKNPPDDVLDGARQAALDAAALLKNAEGSLDTDTFDKMGEELPADLRAWLLELPSFLSKKGREEQGDELCDRYSPLFGAPYMEIERAVVRLEADKKDEALAHMQKCEADFGDHTWVLMRGAFVQERAGHRKTARKGYERALEMAREMGDRKDLRFAYDSLIQHLQESNEQAQAMELSQQMLEDLPEIEEEVPDRADRQRGAEGGSERPLSLRFRQET